MHYKIHTLKNGLRILLAPIKESQTTTVLVMTGTGSRYEVKENNGVSHFLEHMFFKGTKKRPNTLSITSELDAVGGEYNAFTAKDKTGYWAKVGAKHSMVALDVISDIFLNSKFDSKEIERERGTILQEINMYEDMPMRHIDDIYERLLYGDHPLGWEILGPRENIKNLQRKDFVDYVKTHYRSSNVVVCVAGKFNQAAVLKKLRDDFNDFRSGKTPEFPAMKENQTKPQLLIQYKKTDQTHLMLGVRSFDMFHKDRYALSVLSTLLGGNMSSRLFIEVRERKGLAYNVHTYTESYHDAGSLVTQCGVEHENLFKTLEIVLREYKKLTQRKVGAEELNKAKECIKGKLEMGLESSDEIATYLTNQEVLKDRIVTPEAVSKKIDLVTSEDVIRIAREIFQDTKLNLAIIGPHKNKSDLLNMLQL
jgi:predicted Zn-dependent peptidase